MIQYPHKYTQVFMADTEGSGLVIYDSSRKLMCRVESDYMKPTNPHFSVAGQNFTHEGGIYSVTVSGGDLYYAPIAGKELYKIKIRTLLKCPNKERANKQSKLAFKLSSQTGPMTSVKNVIFYSDISNMSLLGKNVYWNWRKPVVLAQDSEKLQTIHGLKYSAPWDQLLCFTDRYQLSALDKMNQNKINFRYFEMNLTEIRAKTNNLFQ
ncbi:PREDICTED: uncharacterized protein LOC105461909 [Wasmannia auropunctata]|uniref:uncharacterized protein LOC105461909 n=1 Tax=Wasmannia auropunctata TaxID=64793 RepID=UPI0005F02429|nr:PREDICTED: uncharacterized protein LOC105461909 [Wasmannia auropunctata]